MKKRRKSFAHTVHLITEDKTGEFVFKEIVEKKKIAVNIVPSGKSKGVSTLAAQIKGLIQTALQKATKQDCIIVLHDTDISTERNRVHYQTIKDICNSYQGRVTRLEAVEEIEAWLLADVGICNWLGVAAKGSDHVPKPSEKFESMINKKFNRRLWTDLQKPKILHDHFNGTGEELSPSMKTAMETLQELSCVKQP